MKVAIGLIIIILSFAYIMKNPGKSMMDAMMEKKKKTYEKQLAQIQAEEAAKQDAAEASELAEKVGAEEDSTIPD